MNPSPLSARAVSAPVSPASPDAWGGLPAACPAQAGPPGACAKLDLLSMVNALTEGLLVCDGQRRITYANPSAARLLGVPLDALVGMRLPEVVASAIDEFDTPIREVDWPDGEVLAQGQPQLNQIFGMRCLDGRTVWVSTNWTPLYAEAGEPMTAAPAARHAQPYAVLVSLVDITQIREAQQRIRHLATHDTLTGLLNRCALEDRLEHALALARRNRSRVSVMFLDLDRFKNVNDTLGHQFGDQLLREVAARLQACAREADTVARLGGDEFVVMLESLDGTGTRRVAERILAAIGAPFHIDGQELFLGVSIGIAVAPHDGDDPNTLLRKADAAMYLAKERGRNNFQTFTSDLDDRVSRRFRIESGLRRASDRNEFYANYQPRVDVRTGRIVGVEALIRWNSTDFGRLMPGQFIQDAEETGLIVEIDRWILRAACDQLARWRRIGLPHLRMSINLSGQAFSSGQLSGMVRGALTSSGLPGEAVELEMTEGILIRDDPSLHTLLTELRALGVSLALDDFGTGYSSLSYLHRFPIDTLKIDRSFVQDLPHVAERAAITRAIIMMAQAMGMKTVAEGVETAGQLEFLSEIGCDEYQGYLLTRPLEPAAMHDLVREHERRYGAARPGFLPL
ncbi:EAL domain-containing protein (plasmid) [Ralstonia solanacearum]|uniref:PAS domain-containing protein n=9 Tax=Ralstonia solanacearum species complex TaxID=3116862 RepID=A0A0S4U2I3_RALSL|nr:GGDEF domain-containing protein [Ralstonia pseudosolanacearum]AUS45711.1 PAS domain-containing protein [Ralstonia solanacearum]QUP61496.1 EAL domain-containing protein [Ralstonia nicotianae]AXV72583.1 GGDEF domain-containing protein [Ralstonia solanacearum]AXV99076.1 GGDEF domain-containing protein [Ralstonia solanacearum]